MRELQDLLWVMHSPGLLAENPSVVGDAWCTQALSLARIRLAAIAARPQDLTALIEGRCRNTKLGEYFEALVEVWLGMLLRMEKLRRNISVERAGRTVGEFDFLFHDRARNQSMHWETAVKFYLFHPKKSLFYGPAGKDRLDLKITKIFDRQLALSEDEPGMEDVRAQAFVKGRLFYPLGNEWRTFTTIPEVNPSHDRGWWATPEQFKEARMRSRWVVLEHRRSWLSGPISDPTFSTEEIAAGLVAHFKHHQRSLMVSAVDEADDGTLTETSRGFITHPDWPFQ